mgnify:CR=1 FL=1
MKKAVILFNLGGPDKIENVEPFLFNLFNDPAILNLPTILRYPLAKLISNRRAPVAKKIYQELGGSSPILKLTEEQAKAALNQMTRNLAQDFGPAIRINAIEPGTIMTEALAPFLTPERTERMLSSTPMGRLGQPEDIAASALFLVSPASSWITGKILGVDGGVEAPNF